MKLALVLSFIASTCLAIDVVHVDAKTPDSIGHIAAATNAVHPEANSIGHVEGTIWAKGEIQPHGFETTIAPNAFTATASTTAPLISLPVNLAEGTVKAPINLSTAADTIHLQFTANIPEKAVVVTINAQGLAQGMEKPLQEVTQTIHAAYSEGRSYILIGSVMVVSLGIAIFLLKHWSDKKLQAHKDDLIASLRAQIERGK